MFADILTMKGFLKMKHIAIVLAMLTVLFSLGACSCDGSDYYSTPNIDSPTSSISSSQSVSLDEISAPKIGGGEYSMLCTFLQSADYYDENGVVMKSIWNMKSRYDFTVSETSDGLILNFTVADRSYVYTYNGTETVIYDTADKSTRSADTSLYFDIVGYGFTVKLDSDYRIVSVSGTKKLYSEVDGAEYLLGEAEIRAIAEELLLALPETVTKTTSVIHSQTIDSESSMEMTYSVSGMSDNMISFTMTPSSEYGLPADETGNGYVVKYTDAADYTGTLKIMSNDRLLQSSSNKITYYSKMDVTLDSGELYSLDGVTTVTDSCEVNQKG